jgi:hypothetical protein
MTLEVFGTPLICKEIFAAALPVSLNRWFTFFVEYRRQIYTDFKKKIGYDSDVYVELVYETKFLLYCSFEPPSVTETKHPEHLQLSRIIIWK